MKILTEGQWTPPPPEPLPQAECPRCHTVVEYSYADKTAFSLPPSMGHPNGQLIPCIYCPICTGSIQVP